MNMTEKNHMPAVAQSVKVTDAMVERAWAAIVGSDVAPICFQASIIRADLKTGLEAVLAAQLPAAPVDIPDDVRATEDMTLAMNARQAAINEMMAAPVETDAAKMCNSYLERALKAEAALAAHQHCSAGNVHLDELPDELNPPAIDQLFARDDLYTARAVFARLRNFGYAVTRNEPQPLPCGSRSRTAPKDGTPIEACNTRHPSHAPVIVRWDGDGLSDDVPEPHWCDAATRDGEALYYNQNYFDFWKPTTALPRPHGGGK
jgi:hypothetical protein